MANFFFGIMKQYYNLKKSWLFAFALVSGLGASAQLYEFSEHTFTNAGAEGKEGPTLIDCVDEYTADGAAWAATYLDMSTPGIQEWTVPASGSYTITAAGAKGGFHPWSGNDGGFGAQMTGTFDLEEGDILYILVGQQGGDALNFDNAAPGGGGGTFVWDPTDDAEPLIAAGGGGGGGRVTYDDIHATDEIDGHGSYNKANGGVGGNGGRNNTGGGSYWAGGGAGWLTNGTGGNQASDYVYTGSYAQGGRRPLEGGIGGQRYNDGFDEGGDGGFGGGGGGGSDNMGTGGGGGYSGGGGNWGSNSHPGGGGGSYNSGADQINIAGVNDGMGYVTIVLNCVPLVPDHTDTGVCHGDPVTLSADSETGGTISWSGGISDGTPFIPAPGMTTFEAFSTSPDDCAYSIDVYSTAVPEITAHSSLPSACEGALITLWGEGGDHYEWTGDGDIDPTDSVAFLAEAGTRTYTVIGSELGCEAPPVELVLEGAPQPEVIGTATPSEVCMGESYTINGGGSGAVSYYWGGGLADGGTVTPETPGTFVHMVVGVSEDGCYDTAFATVNVIPAPMVEAGPDKTVCEGHEVTLLGSGAETYSWDMGVENGIPFVPPVGSTEYTVTGTNAAGCSGEDMVTINVVDLPEITDVVIEDEYYGYDGSIDITVGGGSGDYTFAWSHGPTTEDVDGLTDGVYTVTIDDITIDPGKCPVEETFILTSYVGIEGEAAQSIEIFPNPTADQLNIKFEGSFDYEVVSISGQILISGVAVDQEVISLAELANGTYIVKIMSEEVTHISNIVKN